MHGNDLILFASGKIDDSRISGQLYEKIREFVEKGELATSKALII